MNKKNSAKIIAHRGYWNTPNVTSENSIKALENAQKLRVYGAELDVHMTKDLELIVCHDEHHGEMEISVTNFSDLRKLKLTNGEHIPTLKEYLQQGKKDHTLRLIIEIKPSHPIEREKLIVSRVLKNVDDIGIANQCEFISFSLNICKEIKKQNSFAIVQYLEGDLSPKQIKNEGLDGLDYHYSVYEKNPNWIAEAKLLGLLTNAWTVNEENVYKWLNDLGIDFITTNIPDLLR